MRNLTKTLAMVYMLMPANAYSLGIGGIKLHSTLNQNLNADIALVLAPGEKANDINVRLAPPEKFDESGIPWTYFLSKIKFKTVSSKGRAYIKVTSGEALKEPFLDFLLEVSWPKGNLYREFTVLVDPPSAYEQPTAPDTVESNPYSHYPPETALVRHQAKPRRPVRSVQRASINLSSGWYGPTVRNDTLWKVAERISKQTGISIEQTMIGLYEANPGAFYKPNINALLAGKKLKIPERDVFLKRSRQQALARYKQQNGDWKNRSLELAVASEQLAPEVKSESQLTLVAPQQPSAEAGTPSGTSQPPVAEEQAKASIANGNSATAERNQQSGSTTSTQIIEDKIAALEQQLAAMQKLIALKDEQLAALQQQTQTKPEAVPPEQQQIPQANPKEPSATIQQAKPLEPKNIVTPVAKVAKPQSEEAGMDWYLAAAGIGTGLLIYLGWLLWRRRSQTGCDSDNQYAFANNIQSPAKATDVFSGSALEESSGFDSRVNLDNENLFGGDLVASEFDMFDIDQEEIDPVSEADVYMAYGRYQQAEELIKLAIQDQPERDDYKLKLLEIFFANDNKQAFEAYAEELFNSGKNGNTVFWEKVSEMGAELCPGSTLFSIETSKQEPRRPVSDSLSLTDLSKSSDQLLDETDFDLASFEELFGTESTKDSSTDDANQALFGIEDHDTKNDNEFLSVPVDESESNNQPIDFDLTDFSITNDKAVEEDQTSFEITDEKPVPEPVQTINFSEKPESVSTASSGLADQKTFSFEKPVSFKESIAKTGLDDDFDFNAVMENASGAVDDDKDFSASDITEMDEMDIQLDLAIAYIDMGDKNAAKEIATLVYEQGTDEQKMVAKSLLDNL